MICRGCLPFLINHFICPQENGQNRLRQAQENVEEVKLIMLDNLNKSEERTAKLGELDNRAEQLLEQVDP